MMRFSIDVEISNVVIVVTTLLIIVLHNILGRLGIQEPAGTAFHIAPMHIQFGAPRVGKSIHAY